MKHRKPPTSPVHRRHRPLPGRLVRHAAAALAAGALALAAASCGSAPDPLPTGVTYDDVAAIFERYCLECHSREKAKGELALETYEGLMKGGESGPVITPGDAGGSLLIELVERRKKPFMPLGKRKPRPTRREILVLRAWIEAGAAGPTR